MRRLHTLARPLAAIASAHRPARAFLLVVALAVTVLLLRVPASGSAEGTDVRVSSERFAVALEIGERELTTLGGTAAPLVYWTTDGARHSVTNVLGRKARGATTTYTVATDDPNRRAAISVDAEGERAPDHATRSTTRRRLRHSASR